MAYLYTALFDLETVLLFRTLLYFRALNW